MGGPDAALGAFAAGSWLRDGPAAGREELHAFTAGAGGGGIYYQATRRTESEQLTSLSRIVGRHFDDAALRHGTGFTSWEGLFGYLAERSASGPLLLVLDEFPYLTESALALPSIIQEAWDHRWTDTRIKLILSGSYITTMEELEASNQPLYGRRTLRLTFGPFTSADVGAFVPGYEARDRLRAYGLFGNLPGHLALLDPGVSLAENAAALLLDPQSRLVDDAAHMLDAFLGESSVHYSVLEAIARGETTWSGITSRVGRSGGGLLRPLRWLEGMGLVERVVPITEKKPAQSRRAVYRITDPYVRFWHREIAPLMQAGNIGLVPPEALWEEMVAPRLDDHMGEVFEVACREFVRAAAASPAMLLPFRPIRVGEWWDRSSDAQVDIVALGAKGEVLVGECKWGGVTARHFARLRACAGRVAKELGSKSEPHLVLFSGRGEMDEAVRAEVEAGRLLFFSADSVAGGARSG